jgi:hypothetical protein
VHPVYADIELVNLADETLCEDGYLSKEQIRSMPVTVMADTGAIRLTINENIRKQLVLRHRNEMKVTLADGTVRTLPIAGPVMIKFKDRDCVTDAFVLPNDEEPLLVAVPMELMDLAVIPSSKTLIYNLRTLMDLFIL